MTCRRIAVVLAVLVVLVGSAQAPAQVATGTPPFGSFSGGPDVVNNANLNVHVSIPVRVKAGRGIPFTYTLSYDSSVWFPVGVSGSQVWTPVTNWGWRAITEAAVGYISYDTKTRACRDQYGELYQGIVYKNWAYYDSFGVKHGFILSLDDEQSLCYPATLEGTVLATDGSGYTLSAFSYASPPGGDITARSGDNINAPLQSGSGSGTAYDTNGNWINASTLSGTTTFTDTLGTTVLTVSGLGTPTSPLIFKYTNPLGGLSSFTMKYSPNTVKTNFVGCSGISQYGPTTQNLVSEIGLPDGTKYTFGYEPTPGYAGDVTGRIASIQLPTGGTISYSYSGGNNGITCADGSTATLTRATPDGTWGYAHSESGTAWTTGITDPVGKVTSMHFQGIHETSRTLPDALGTVLTCYNSNLTNCDTTAISLPIRRRTVTSTLGALTSKADTFYDTYGQPTKVDEYGYGSGAPGGLVRKTVIAYASPGNNIVDRPSSITVYKSDGVTVAAQTTLSYDQTAVTATSGTPQHVAISGSRGNLTTATYTTQGTSTISRTSTYFDTGLVQTATDVNAAQTTYTYNSTGCANSLLTSISLPLPLSRSMVWNCTGGAATSVTDENTKTTSCVYNDPNYWRLKSITDPSSAVTNISYFTVPFASESTLNFNGTTSTVDSRTTLDGLGRAQIVQRRQAQGSTSYDSVETDYDSVGRPWAHFKLASFWVRF